MAIKRVITQEAGELNEWVPVFCNVADAEWDEVVTAASFLDRDDVTLSHWAYQVKAANLCSPYSRSNINLIYESWHIGNQT